MATVAGRRRSSGGGSTTSAGTSTTMAPTATSSSGHGKRPSVSSTKSGGSGSRNRIDPSLMMSTKATDKSSDDVRNLSRAGGSRHNKSSDRLNRMGGGASSTNLTSNKRSKSYSQIMSAGAASNASGSGKKKKEVVQDADNDEDEDGWMSSSQRGTPVESGSPQSGSDDGDEGLVMNAKEKPSMKKSKSNAEGGSTPRGRNHDIVKAGEEKTPLKRNDTQVTLRGFDARQGEDREQADSVAFPADDETEEGSTEKQINGKQSSQILKESAANHTASTSGTGAQDSIAFPSSSGQRMPSLQREPSTMSGRTLTPSEHGQETSSPTSVKSRSSLRSLRSRTSLYPRESQGPAAPKLSTHYALAGALGSLQEESELERAMSQQVKRLRPGGAGMPSSKSEASHLHQRYHFDAGDSNFQIGESSRRKSSISSIQTNTIKLPTTSPSLGDVSHDAIRAEQVHQRSGSSAFDVMQRVSGFHTNANNGRTEHDRRRTTSTKSLTAADAASLAAKLRLARGESFEDAQTSASKMLASSSSKYFATVSRSDAASTKALKEYNKPTISVFVKRLGERKNIEVKVPRGGLFDDDFTRASVGDQGGTGGAKGKGDDDDDDDDDGDEDSEDALTVRYVMDFGLSGPAVQKTATAEALLGTLLDHDEFEATWAPALANAAGLGEGTRRAREAARTGGALDSMQFNGLTSTGGVAINGPNATPMHFLHGLTNTTDAPFPLEPSDMATSANQHLHGGSNDALEGSGEYLDAKNLRAIAMTWTALNVNKSHIVTRRYVDPMRESLERIGRANGTLAGKGGTGMAGSTTSPHPGHSTPGSGATTPGGSLRWGAWRNLFSEHQQQHHHQQQASE